MNNFAPRFGFAYSPKVNEGSFLHGLMGDQQTVIRGGFGVFYGAIVGDTALQQLTAPGFRAPMLTLRKLAARWPIHSAPIRSRLWELRW